LSRAVKRRISFFCRSREHLRLLHPNGKGQNPQSVDYVSHVLRKSTAASGWPGSEREQPLMKVARVKFLVGPKEEW